MSCQKEGLALLKKNEGLRLNAYKDSVGVLTIGYGTSAPEYEWLTGKKLTAQTFVKQDEADALLHKWFLGHKIYTDLIKAGVKEQNVFDALCSFAYNVGRGGLTGEYDLNHMQEPGFYTEKLTKYTHAKFVSAFDSVKTLLDLIKKGYPPSNIACCLSWWRSPKVIRPRRAREIDPHS